MDPRKPKVDGVKNTNIRPVTNSKPSAVDVGWDKVADKSKVKSDSEGYYVIENGVRKKAWYHSGIGEWVAAKPKGAEPSQGDGKSFMGIKEQFENEANWVRSGIPTPDKQFNSPSPSTSKTPSKTPSTPNKTTGTPSKTTGTPKPAPSAPLMTKEAPSNKMVTGDSAMKPMGLQGMDKMKPMPKMGGADAEVGSMYDVLSNDPSQGQMANEPEEFDRLLPYMQAAENKQLAKQDMKLAKAGGYKEDKAKAKATLKDAKKDYRAEKKAAARMEEEYMYNEADNKKDWTNERNAEIQTIYDSVLDKSKKRNKKIIRRG